MYAIGAREEVFDETVWRIRCTAIHGKGLKKEDVPDYSLCSGADGLQILVAFEDGEGGVSHLHCVALGTHRWRRSLHHNIGGWQANGRHTSGIVTATYYRILWAHYLLR